MKRWLASRSIGITFLVVSLLLVGCGGSNSVVPPEGKPIFAATPEFVPPGGAYGASINITIASDTEGAKIYYTTDGSDPLDTHGALYDSPIQVSATTTLKAVAYADGTLGSVVGTANYVISGNQPPVLSGATITGAVLPQQTMPVSITCVVSDVDGFVLSVTADLSSLGGSAVVALVKGSGNQWSWTGQVRPTTEGNKQIRITATDDQGAVASTVVSVVASSPVGTEKWHVSVQGPIVSSPAIGQDGTIYFGCSDRNLYAVRADGTVKWTYPAGGIVTGCPAVGEDGTIYVGGGSSLHAVNPDGSRRWSIPTGESVYGSAAIGVRGTVIVGTIGGTLLAVAPDGTTLWKINLGTSMESSPSVDADGTIYIGGYDGKLYAVYPSGRLKGQAWPFVAGGVIATCPAIGSDGTVYVGSADGSLYAINASGKYEGTKRWQAMRGDVVTTSAAIGPDGTLYVGSRNNRLAALDSETGTIKWEFLTSSPVTSTPTVSQDGVIYFGCSSGTFHAVGVDGNERWHFTLGNQVLASAAVGVDGTVYVGGVDKLFYAIAGTKGMAGGIWPTLRGDLRRTGAAVGMPLDNIAPKVTNAAVSGLMVEKRSGRITVSCTALDPDANLTGVVADLSALGGSASQVLTAGSNDQYSWSGNVTPPDYGMMTVRFIATDTDGAKTIVAKSDVRVLGVPATGSASVTPDSLVRMTKTRVSVSCTASDPDGTVQTVVADLSGLGGGAAQPLTNQGGGVWVWSGDLTPSTVGTPVVTFRATDNEGVVTTATANVTVVNSRPTISNAKVLGQLVQDTLCDVTVSCDVTDIDGSVVSVVADLSSIGGSSQQALTEQPAGTWSWKGQVTPKSWGFVPVGFVATDNDQGIRSGAASPKVLLRPAFEDMSFTGMLTGGTPSNVMVACRVSDLDGDLATVQVEVDLTAIGGAARQVLTANGDGTWSWSGTLTPPTSGSKKKLTFQATDGDGLISHSDRQVDVQNSIPGLETQSLAGLLMVGRLCAATASCAPSDVDGTIVRVTVDLSAIDGAYTQPVKLQPGANGTWTWSGTVVPGAAGWTPVPFIAYDNEGAHIENDSAVMIVLAPEVSDARISGTLLGNTASSIVVSCKAVDPDGEVDTVTVDLTAIGGPSAQALSKGADDVYSWAGQVTPPKSHGTVQIRFRAVDKQGAWQVTPLNVTIENALPSLTNPKIAGPLGQNYDSTITVTCLASDVDGLPTGDAVTVEVDLSLINGSKLTLSPSNGACTWTGKVVPTATGTFTIPFTVTDVDNAKVSVTFDVYVGVAPVASNPDVVVVSGNLVGNQTPTVKVSCTTSDADNAVTSAVADLSLLGGSNAQALMEEAPGLWSWTGTVHPTGLGDMAVAFTATDATGLVSNKVTKVVPISQTAPLVTDIIVTGILQDGRASNVTISCRVTDDGTISNLVADLSAIGGSNAVVFVDRVGDRWSWAGTVTPAGQGNKTLSITATDNSGLTGSASASLLVNPDTKWAPLSLNGAIESSPAMDAAGTVYVGSSDGKLYAIQPDGTAKWAAATLGGAIMSSPAIDANGVIYVGSNDGNLYAVNSADGSVLWSFLTTDNKPVASSPAISADGSTVYVGSDDGKLYAINTTTHLAAWAAPFVTGGRILSTPAVAGDGTIYVGSLDKKVYAINSNGTQEWVRVTGGIVASSPAIGTDGTVYVAAFGVSPTYSRLYALNPADGLDVWASFGLGGLYAYSSPAIGADGTIYIGAESDGGKVYAIDSATGGKKWECLVDGTVRSSPLIGSDGVVYVGTRNNAVYAINPNGTVKWTFLTYAEVRSSPALAADGTLYVGCYDWNLYAINASGSLANSAWPMFRGGPLHTGRGNGQ